MSADFAQSRKWNEDRAKLAQDQARTIHPHPPASDVIEAANSADGPSDYLPGRWSWGPAKSAFNW
ncbi:hypothetical protein [Bradyrhizobium canariense]|uniref:hypothetical protein n=1 Tax=Bradyrhizobium canariense TaxID=255045 RepID=UPI000A191E3F|nr:hypothetical protein [Bradyrhizobium canariense]OSI98448.1 hypothetical protein BSZ16_31690 [Bradyrhizobium canariense]